MILDLFEDTSNFKASQQIFYKHFDALDFHDTVQKATVYLKKYL